MSNSSDESSPAIVAVIGSTGVGKSSFINAASGSALGVGTDLRSCTAEVQGTPPFKIHTDGPNVVLVDTPGFDDTTRSDTDILRAIAKYLKTEYKAGTHLTGIIYMHRISDPRVGGIARRNFQMFRELCGTENFERVTIVTTFWDAVDSRLADKRQQQLVEDKQFFQPMINGGALLRRYNREGRNGEAGDILDELLQREHHELRWLRLQQELGRKMPLPITKAGAVFNTDLTERAQQLYQRKQELQRELKEAKGQDKQDLEEDRRELERQIKDIRDQLKKLTKDLEAQGFAKRLFSALFGG